MALWVEEQLLAMRDFELKFYISKAEKNGPGVEALNYELIRKFVHAARILFGVRIDEQHVAKEESLESDKLYRWTYAWQPNTGVAYAPEYDKEFTLKSMSYSLPKGLVKLRVTDELKRTMEDDSRRDRFFELSSWDDSNNRWIYRVAPRQ